MLETFRPYSRSIRQLFGNDESLYQIPDYQRPYSWTDEHVEALWEDVYTAYKNNAEDPQIDGSYFLGSIITITPEEKSIYRDVVDGQQRLTTLMILFCVVRDLYPAINKDSASDTAVSLSRIKKSIFDNDEKRRLRFYTHGVDQSDFEALVVNANTCDIIKPPKTKVAQDPKIRFLNTAAILRDQLLKIGENEASAFINYLFNNVHLINIECSSRPFAIKLFQVLNDRGLDLSNADLIKSFLRSKIKEPQKIAQFTADWSNIENVVKEIKDDGIDDLLIYYEYFHLGANPKKSLAEEFEALCKSRDANEIAGDIKKFVSVYKNELWDVNEKTLNSLWYIRWNAYFKSILITAKYTQYPEFEELVRELRRFYYLYWMSGRTLTKIKQTSFNIIGWVKNRLSILEIRANLSKKLEEDNIISDVLSVLKGPIYGEAWVKPLLLSIEYNIKDDGIQFVDISKDSVVHIEHVLPQGYETMSQWKHIEPAVAQKWLHNAANLTLLSGSKNSEAKNYSFDDKINIYIGSGKNRNKRTGITSFHMTQLIINDYNSKKYDGMWNEAALIARWNWFCDEVAHLLDIETDSIRCKN